jgi:FecR protein
MSDERHIQELIRSLPGPEGEPAFREALRAEFVAGMPGADASADGDGTRVTEAPRRVVPLRLGLVGLAIAASLLAFFFVWPRGPEWNVVAVAGEGSVTVNGTTYPSAEALQRMPRTLSPGVHVSVEGGTMLDLAAPGVLSIQLAPGSELEVPGRVAAAGRATYEGLVARGEVRFVTGPDFAGSRLDLDAPAAHVIVTGTTFAVITDADTTCVCVLEGTVEMVSVDGAKEAVTGGTRRTLRRETGEAHAEEILPMERMKLQMLRDAVLGAADADAAGTGR